MSVGSGGCSLSLRSLRSRPSGEPRDIRGVSPCAWLKPRTAFGNPDGFCICPPLCRHAPQLTNAHRTARLLAHKLPNVCETLAAACKPKALQSFPPAAASRPVEQRNMTRADHPRARGSVLWPVQGDFCHSSRLATSPELIERGNIRAPRYARPASHPSNCGAPFPSSGSTLAARSGCAELLRRSRRSMPRRRSRD